MQCARSEDHQDQLSPTLTAALTYAQRGWRVFPVHTPVKGQCSCWQVECASPGKHPRTSHGCKDATINATQIQAWRNTHPDANVGIATGRTSGLVVVDIDPKHGGDDSLQALEQEHGMLPDAVEVLTGSLGRHLFFQHPIEHGLILRNHTCTKLGRGIDIRGEGGYVVAPPSVHVSGRHYCWEVSSHPDDVAVVPLPNWLLQLLQSPSPLPLSTKLTGSKILNGHRNETLFRMACCMRGQGLTRPEIHAVLLQINSTSCEPPLPLHEVLTIAHSAARYAPSPPGPDWLQDMNQKHAVVMVGGKTVILNEDYDPVLNQHDISLSHPSDLTWRYKNRMIEHGNSQETIATAWLGHAQRREYQGIVFASKRHIPGYYNLWQGFAVEPTEGDCRLYLDHLYTNIAQGDQASYNYYILGWMAQTVQFPDQRVGVSIVLRGKQGPGKGVMCTQFLKLFGRHFIQVQRHSHLLGNFNAHLKDKLVVFADEAFLAGDKATEGALKAMVTEEQIPIEYKGKDVFYVQNHTHLLVASNHDWVVPTGLEERRFFVIDVGEERMQDHAYFGTLVQQMDQGGREAFLRHLLQYYLSGINLRQFPQTAALQENKILSMSPAEKFWYERLQAGTLLSDEPHWTGRVVKQRLHEEYIAHAKETGQSRKSTQTELGLTLKRLVPGLRSANRKIDGKRAALWEFPDLTTCRSSFDHITRFQHEWPEGDGSEGDHAVSRGGTC